MDLTPDRCARRRSLVLLVGGAAALSTGAAFRVFAEATPSLMLAKVYRSGIDVPKYWVSEKLDGVRAYWDGLRLVTRRGNAIAAPAWFTRDWPSVPLDGELWIGRGQFTKVVSTVRQRQPDDAQWRSVRFMAFDLPGRRAPFSDRMQELASLLASADDARLMAVEQRRVANEVELRALLKTIVDQGGEGLVLHRGDALWQPERSDALLKLKPLNDDDARVVAHVPGAGRNAGRLGALIVEAEDGRRFRVGTGLTDADRADPPPVGSWISYRHAGHVEGSGLPRFPAYLRRRPDLDERWQ